MTLGELISVSRELRKYTLRDLEKRSGVANAQISQIETGKIKDPGFRTVCKLAAALEIGLDRLAECER